MQNYNRILLVVGILVVGVIAGLIVLFVHTSDELSRNKSDITSLQTQQGSLQSGLSTASSQISSLTAQLQTANSQIATLQTNNSSAGSQISALNTDLATAKSQITALTNQVNAASSDVNSLKTGAASASSSISSLQTQLATINTQLNSLQTTVTSLQNSVTPLQSSLTGLQTTLTSLQTTVTSLQTTVNSLSNNNNNVNQGSTALFTSTTVTQNFGAQTTLGTFTPTYNGYVYINGTSSSITGYVRIVNNSLSTFVDYTFGTGATISAPVTAAYSYSIMFGNRDTAGTITATLSGTYYPGSSSTTGNTTLFTTLPVSQNFNAETALITFAPTHAGYIYVSGVSSSPTGYIRVYNNTLSTHADFAFGTGTTVIAPVVTGYTYTIVFGNTATTGPITATLTAVY